MKLNFFLATILITCTIFAFQNCFDEKEFISVLVFSKTEGFRHHSIDAGKQALLAWGDANNIRVDTTENAALFQEKNLKNYHVVVFLNTTGDVLNDAQQLEFSRFIQAGGGFVGIHSAADTEHSWPWYGDLVGAYFKNHPKIQAAEITQVGKPHDCTKHLPARFTKTDEWYNYKNIRPHIEVLLNLEESSYEGGENGDIHPITWCHEFDGGRAFYTGLGHTKESYADPDMIELLDQGIRWAAANKVR